MAGVQYVFEKFFRYGLRHEYLVRRGICEDEAAKPTHLYSVGMVLGDLEEEPTLQMLSGLDCSCNQSTHVQSSQK